MDLDEYQRIARAADQNPKPDGCSEPSQNPQKHEVIPLLGLVGEVGGLLGASTRSCSAMVLRGGSFGMK